MIILTKEQAEALETIKQDDTWPLESMINYHVSSVWHSNPYNHLNDMDLATLLEAYFCGYEVEKSPEDKVYEMYNNGDVGIKTTVRMMLGHLNIKIKGIND